MGSSEKLDVFNQPALDGCPDDGGGEESELSVMRTARSLQRS